jgi:hypothetical protein
MTRLIPKVLPILKYVGIFLALLTLILAGEILGEYNNDCECAFVASAVSRLSLGSPLW